ncbi:MAG TPA: sortase [Candidatus Limnocylindria bacterium]|nr:sortase [Candidatus Limnocylindria bacterium]
MRRLSPGMVVPLLLAVAGVALIMVGQLDLDQPPGPSLPGIPDPSTPIAVASPTLSAEPSEADSPSPSTSPDPTPSPTPIPADWVAVQIEIESVGINVPVRQAIDAQHCDFPPSDAAYVLCGGSQPGRDTNSYIFAHAVEHLFKPLWNVQLGHEVEILMSDGAVLRYQVTEVRPNISCPDSRAPGHPNPPLALLYAPPGCEDAAQWTQPTDYERLTLQTSQGFNRNWGELIIVAEPMA